MWSALHPYHTMSTTMGLRADLPKSEPTSRVGEGKTKNWS